MKLVLVSLAFFIGSYLIGGLNGAIILSRLVYHEDIREKGSKNPGFTNFKRVYGMNLTTIFVVIIDALKTVLPVLSALLVYNAIFATEFPAFGASFGAQLAALGCMLGHSYPIYYGFKGGKAVLAGATAIWFVDWKMALIIAAVFCFFLFVIKYMSLSSIMGAFTAPIALLLLNLTNLPTILPTLIGCIMASALIIARHHANIYRLFHKQESKFSLFGKEKSKEAKPITPEAK